MKNLSANIREARERAGFTQAEAAAALELKKATFASYERTNSNDPPIATLCRIATLFHISLDRLCGIRPAIEDERRVSSDFVQKTEANQEGHITATFADGQSVEFADADEYDRFTADVQRLATQAQNAVYQAALQSIQLSKSL